MKVLVTGATGQLGFAVARALTQRGEDVRCLVRNRKRAPGLDAELVEGDLSRPDGLAPAFRGVEVVFHLAGVVSYRARDLPELQRVNVDGTRAVLDAAALAGVRRVLLTSSIATLGYLEDPNAVGDEGTAYNWHGEGIGYFDTKREAETLVLGERRLEGLAVNPGITFGAHDVHKNAGRMILQVDAGGPPAVPCGATTVVNLTDVVDGHLLAMDHGRAGERYVLSAWNPSFLELYAKIAERMGRPAPTRVLPRWVMLLAGRLGDWRATADGPEPALTLALARISSRNRRYGSAKAQSELGWRPHPIDEGIDACVGWYREQGYVR